MSSASSATPSRPPGPEARPARQTARVRLLAHLRSLRPGTEVDAEALRSAFPTMNPSTMMVALWVLGRDRLVGARWDGVGSGRRRLWRALALAALVLVAAAPARAQELPTLEAGQPAPAPGILFDEGQSKALVEDLRDLRTLRGVAETQKAQLAAKDRQIGELEAQVLALKEAARSAEITYARQEERDKMRAEVQASLAGVLEESRKTLDDTRKALERADARIESLEKRQFYMMLLGPLGFALGYALFGL